MSTPKAHRGLFTGPAVLLPRIENPRPSTSQSQYSRGTSRHSRDFSGASPSNQHERESTSNSQSSKIELLSPPNIKNGRISMAAQLAAHRKKVASATRLSPVSETELLRDIIYILQGIDGKWIQFTEVEEAHIPGYDGVIIEPNNDLFTEAGIQFTTSTTHSIPAPTRDLLHTLAELGWLFKKISRGIEKGKEREDCGMIEQSLHSALGIELTEYFRLIAVLEGEVNDLNEEFEEGVGGENQSGALTLRRLLVWTEDIRLRMRMMAVLIEESKS